MDKKAKGELLMSILFAFLGVGAVFVIHYQETGALSNTGATDFRTLPTFAGAMLVIFSLANAGKTLAGSFRNHETQDEMSEKTQNTENSRRVRLRIILMFLLCLTLALLMKNMSFPVLVFGFLFLAFLVLGQKNMLVNAAVSLLGSGFIYVVFIILLKLPL